MKNINGFWVDENGNKWTKTIYTEENAEKCSKTLLRCHNCIGCTYCMDCNDCSYCGGCNDCTSCTGCHECERCNDCCSCSHCTYCHDYKRQPWLYKTNNIDCDGRSTTFYCDEEHNVQVVHTDFVGNLEEFKNTVDYRNGECSSVQKKYKEIKKVEVLFGLNKKSKWNKLKNKLSLNKAK